MDDGMHSNGGRRIVTTARTVCDVLRGRSCDDLQVHLSETTGDSSGCLD